MVFKRMVGVVVIMIEIMVLRVMNNIFERVNRVVIGINIIIQIVGIKR